MNDNTPSTTRDLPDLPQASIDRMETAVFSEIAANRTSAPLTTPAAARRGRSRRRGWLTGLGVAAAFVCGVLIAPPLLTITEMSDGSGGATSAVSESAVSDVDTAAPDGSVVDAAGGVAADAEGREIIANADATVRVDDIADAVDAVTALADEHGGYVESTDISASGESAVSSTSSRNGEYGSIGIRVPAADLAAVVEALGETGKVISSSTSKQDVTATAIDLRARAEATQASVDRLTELMAQSGSVSELIDAEVALTERQAELESYTQQLAALEDQVAMSSLQVQLTEQSSVTSAEPDGFADGLLAGWNGLIVSLNALVITLGFLLPWLVIAGAVILVIWFIRRRRRRTAADNH